jgi:NhaP-type Na+/H+ or K+/H+ antiporter
MQPVVQVTLESAIVGCLTTVFGVAISWLIGKILQRVFHQQVDTSFNKFHVMEIALFVTGFLVNVFTELIGLNLYYCRHGYACQKKSAS